jgi:hypothetical protein
VTDYGSDTVDLTSLASSGRPAQLGVPQIWLRALGTRRCGAADRGYSALDRSALKGVAFSQTNIRHKVSLRLLELFK